MSTSESLDFYTGPIFWCAGNMSHKRSKVAFEVEKHDLITPKRKLSFGEASAEEPASTTPQTHPDRRKASTAESKLAKFALKDTPQQPNFELKSNINSSDWKTPSEEPSTGNEKLVRRRSKGHEEWKEVDGGNLQRAQVKVEPTPKDHMSRDRSATQDYLDKEDEQWRLEKWKMKNELPRQGPSEDPQEKEQSKQRRRSRASKADKEEEEEATEEEGRYSASSCGPKEKKQKRQNKGTAADGKEVQPKKGKKPQTSEKTTEETEDQAEPEKQQKGKAVKKKPAVENAEEEEEEQPKQKTKKGTGPKEIENKAARKEKQSHHEEAKEDEVEDATESKKAADKVSRDDGSKKGEAKTCKKGESVKRKADVAEEDAEQDRENQPKKERRRPPCPTMRIMRSLHSPSMTRRQEQRRLRKQAMQSRRETMTWRFSTQRLQRKNPQRRR